MLHIHMQYKKIDLQIPRINNISRKFSVVKAKTQKNNIAFCRTNMLGDYIEKLSTDINMISYSEEGYECKYIAMINACIIIIIMLYMFFDCSIFQSIFGMKFKMSSTKQPD
jgi:hypothetical protein